MWHMEKTQLELQKENLFNELFSEFNNRSSQCLLPPTLKDRLLQLSPEDRKDVTSRKRDGCAPLFIACKKGCVDIAKFLITQCGARVDQKGLYIGLIPHGSNLKHHVTPLWYAASTGKLSIVKLLLAYGAHINTASDTGSTPVNTACCMKHTEVVKEMVEQGASILRPDYYGITCLMHACQTAAMTDFLLQQGAPVNARDHRGQTALHYAVNDGRYESVKLLLDNRADPLLKTIDGDDALCVACLKGFVNIFDYLMEKVIYSGERIAEAHELLGSTILEQQHDINSTVEHWNKALDIRYEFSQKYPKIYRLDSHRPYLEAVEFESHESLEILSIDADAMHIQSLLVCERILGPQHEHTISRLVCRGIAYGSLHQYQRCIDLWIYAVRLQISKLTLLHSNTCSDVQGLIQLYMDMIANPNVGSLEEELSCDDVLCTMSILVDELENCVAVLKIHPVFQKRQNNFDRIIRILSYLCYILHRLPKNETQTDDFFHLLEKLLRIDPRTFQGDSLLHLVMSQNNTLNSSIFFPYNKFAVFPNAELALILVEHGADVNATNEALETPLHVAACALAFNNEAVVALIDKGAHLDQRDKEGLRPHSMLAKVSECNVNPASFLSLKCLTAQKILEYKIPYEGKISHKLESFVKLH